MKGDNILVTGGSGLVGRRLIPLLLESGYKVRLLSRANMAIKGTELFRWDLARGEIEAGALTDVDHIIHLAGENIGQGRWSTARKKEILTSRVASTQMLFDSVKREKPVLKSSISASATGYYGAVTSDRIFTEEDPPGNDFPATICVEWEGKSELFKSEGIRTSVVRTGIVLSPEGGMLGAIKPTLRLRVSPLFGNGKHYIPWIHIDDLCGIYLKMVEDSQLQGIFNAVAPDHADYRRIVREIASARGIKTLSPSTPSFIWKLLFGEQSVMLLNGSRVSSSKILSSGYKFRFPDLKGAMEDLMK